MTQNSDESIFLLDDRGCPTNLNIFPAFSKIKTNETNQLVATFQAFKFASSPVIRFSVIVQFCPSTCPEVTCGKTTPNRQKRQVKLRLIDPVESTKVIKINRTEFGQASKTEELPLEFIMVVRDPKISSDRYVVGERNKILVAGFGKANHFEQPSTKFIHFRSSSQSSMPWLLVNDWNSNHVGLSANHILHMLRHAHQTI